MTDPRRRWVNRGLRWALGATFIVAAAGVPGTRWGRGKLSHPSSFAGSIRQYQMVPEILVFPVAVYLPWLELMAGVTLLAGVWPREALRLAMLLCTAFLIVNVAALARGLEVDCGCFGAAYHGSAQRESVIVVIMLAAAVGALRTIRPTPASSIDSAPGRRRTG